MDRQVMERKLEALRVCLQRLRDRRPASAQLLALDQDAQDVLVLNLARAVQLCVDMAAHLLAGTSQSVPATMAEAFLLLARLGVIDDDLALRMRRSVGFRNIAVHNYEVLNWQLVFELAGDPLRDFDRFAVAVAQHLQESKQ